MATVEIDDGEVDEDVPHNTIIDGRYRVTKVIGRGGAGVVYGAVDTRDSDRAVAVKVLRSREEDLHRRFLREGRVLSRLGDPNTVRVLDEGIWKRPNGNNAPYLVMEHIQGETLKALFARGRMDPLRLLGILMQIACALEEAHDQGLVHRDLKPSNVLVSSIAGGSELVTVVDFGLVKDLDRGEATGDYATADGTVVGTPMFMAPEQVQAGTIDARADIYSLGILLYLGLTAEYPYDAATRSSMMVAHVHAKPRPFAEVAPDLNLPACLEFVAMSCMEKEPEHRFCDVRQFIRALRVCEIAVTEPAFFGVTLRVASGRVVPPEEIRLAGRSFTRPGVPFSAVSTTSTVAPTRDRAANPDSPLKGQTLALVAAVLAIAVLSLIPIAAMWWAP